MSKGELKKDRILVAGLEVMKANGFHATSINDIVAAAEVPKGSFYNYFDSKETFAIEAIDRVASEGFAESERTLHDRSLSPLDRLNRYFSRQVNECCSLEFKVGCFLGNIGQEMADCSEPIRAKLDTALIRQTQLIASVLDEAKACGEMDAQTESLVLANFLFNAWEGTLLRMKAAKSRAPLDAFISQLPRLLKA